MKKFVILYLSSLVSLLLLIAFLNYWIDPAGIYSQQARAREHSMAEIILSKNNILVDFNYDERLFQKYRIEMESLKNGLVVLGSSRCLQISSHVFKRPLLNISVSGARVEDFVALSVLVKERLHPNMVMLGVDPWMFNLHNEQTSWKSLSYEYRNGLQVIGCKQYSENVILPDRYLQLLNYEYSRESFALLWKMIHKQQTPSFSVRTSDDSTSDADLVKSDGSRIYNKTYAAHSIERVKADAILMGTRSHLHSFRDFIISDSALDNFQCLLDYLDKDTRVIIFLPPFHPSAYPIIRSKCNLVETVERTIRMEAGKRGIQVFGSYDPVIAGCGEKDFFDGMHPKDRCISKVFTGLSHASTIH